MVKVHVIIDNEQSYEYDTRVCTIYSKDFVVEPAYILIGRYEWQLQGCE